MILVLLLIIPRGSVWAKANQCLTFQPWTKKQNTAVLFLFFETAQYRSICIVDSQGLCRYWLYRSTHSAQSYLMWWFAVRPTFISLCLRFAFPVIVFFSSIILWFLHVQGTAASEQACLSFEYIWTHEEACGYVVKILCNPLCAGVCYALSLILSQSSASFTQCLVRRP